MRTLIDHEARRHEGHGDFVSSCLRGSERIMSRELTYLEAIREALAEEMRRDPKVFVLGEDVGATAARSASTQGLLRGVRRDARRRHADLGVGDHRRQHRRVAARLPAGRRDAVRRLHLVRLRSDRQPGGDAALPLRRPRVGADRRARAERRQRRRRPLSLAEPGGVVHPPAGAEGGRAVDGLRRQGAA